MDGHVHTANQARSITLMQCATEAVRDGRFHAAVALAEVAAAAHPTVHTALQLSEVHELCGEVGKAQNIRLDALARFPASAYHIKLQRAYYAARRGELTLSGKLYEELLAEFPACRDVHYPLGGVFALLGQHDRANDLFARGALVTCGDGSITSARTIHIPDRPGDGSVPVPLARCCKIGAMVRRDHTIDCIYAVACDSKYLNLFAAAMCRSIVANSGLRCAIHFHVINPDDAALRSVRSLADMTATPVSWSVEEVDLSGLSLAQQRTYYACARYFMLPSLLRESAVPIILADIDMIVIRSLADLLTRFVEHDVGLMRFDHSAPNPLSMISASFVLFAASDGARRFATTLRDNLAGRMIDPASFAWHLDQAGLFATYLFHSDIKFQNLSPTIMYSQVVRSGVIAQPSEHALLWSVTATHAANLAQLADPGYMRLVDGSVV